MRTINHLVGFNPLRRWGLQSLAPNTGNTSTGWNTGSPENVLKDATCDYTAMAPCSLFFFYRYWSELVQAGRDPKCVPSYAASMALSYSSRRLMVAASIMAQPSRTIAPELSHGR